MKLSFIHAGYLKLDGGAMFGIVPKTLWHRMNPPDEKNLCTWAMRCLLIETDDRKILVDTGIGNKQDEKWKSFFEPHGPENLHDSLAKKGLSPADITDVLLTHLHFDHVGGAVERSENGELQPTFPNATYWSVRDHWNWAMNPNEREKASFLKENFVPLMDKGQVQFLDVLKEKDDFSWLPGIRLRPVFGHTEAMVLPIIDIEGKTFTYCADLIPSSFHIGMPYIMAYDVRPLETLKEKDLLLKEAVEQDWTLLFEHDPKTGAAKVTADEKGRIRLGEPVEL